MIRSYKHQELRLDAFLRSAIEPAAQEYSEQLVFCANNPEHVMPKELDKKCQAIIEGRPCCLLRGFIQGLLAATIIASLLAVSVFAVYKGIQCGLNMARIDLEEGSEIRFEGEDAVALKYAEPEPEIVLGYLPDGFECTYKDEEVIRYSDENGKKIVLDIGKTISSTWMVLNTEDANVIPVTVMGHEGYMSAAMVEGKKQTKYIWFDQKKQVAYRFISLGLSEDEVSKILEGIRYENE